MTDVQLLQKALVRKHPTDPVHAAMKRIEAVHSVAYQWWKSRRPVSFTEADHIANPTVNTMNAAEAAMAQAVADTFRNASTAPMPDTTTPPAVLPWMRSDISTIVAAIKAGAPTTEEEWDADYAWLLSQPDQPTSPP